MQKTLQLKAKNGRSDWSMPIPNYQECMLPLLEFLVDRQDHRLRDFAKAVAARFGLTEPERAEMLPSGQQTVISNRVAWAKTYLKKAGLLDNPARGRVRISAQGTKILSQHPSRIDQ